MEPLRYWKKYTNGIINKAIEIEDTSLEDTDDELKHIKFAGARMFSEDEDSNEDVFSLLSINERNLFELAYDIATFKYLITDAENKETIMFSVGNMILNLKE